MFVCLCRAVRDRDITEVVRGGARTVAQVSAASGAGTVCGSCLPHVKKLLDEGLRTLDGRR